MPGDTPSSLTAGQKVGAGRFTLIRQLGRGGMGIVWLAKDTRLNDEVALKFLPPEVATDDIALDDLRRETLKSRKLTHSHIVRIHDLYEAPDELPFISMEYVDGLNLAKLRLQQPQRCFTWESLEPLVVQLCQALEYAHGEKIIHRDLKPSNLMLDARARLKVADFGIAATMSDSMSRVSQRTRDTSGTLNYMSPQQMRGEKPSLTDDIYALGATLYELLSGTPPFYRGVAAAIMHQVLNEPAPTLAKRLVEQGVTNEIPASVCSTIMSCLIKDEAERPQSAQAVAKKLADLLIPKRTAPPPIPATPPTLGTMSAIKATAPAVSKVPLPPEVLAAIAHDRVTGSSCSNQ